MAAFKVPLKIDQGASFSKLVTWKTGAPAAAVDLTGCTALAHIRETLESEDILITLSTANGKIVLGGVAGTVEIMLSAAETAAITWRRLRCRGAHPHRRHHLQPSDCGRRVCSEVTPWTLKCSS